MKTKPSIISSNISDFIKIECFIMSENTLFLSEFKDKYIYDHQTIYLNKNHIVSIGTPYNKCTRVQRSTGSTTYANVSYFEIKDINNMIYICPEEEFKNIINNG